MAKRVPASMRTRESLSDLIEGRLSSADGRAALVKCPCSRAESSSIAVQLGSHTGMPLKSAEPW